MFGTHPFKVFLPFPILLVFVTFLAAPLGWSQHSSEQPSASGQGGHINPTYSPYPNWGGVVIESFITVPNAQKGAFGGEAVQMRFRSDPRETIDLSGHTLQTDTGSVYTIPQGTVLYGRQYLLVDFSDGEVKIDPQIRAESGTIVLLAQGFSNTFFNNGVGNGRADLLALVDPDGRIVDAVLFAEGSPFPSGPLVNLAVQQKQWPAGEYVPQGAQDPAEGDIYYTRAYPDAVDTNTWMDWGPTPMWWPEPTPGSSQNWYNDGVRTYAEAQIGGQVVTVGLNPPEAVPIEGAVVTLPDHNLFAATDADGFYTIERAPPGTYKVLVTAPGYVPMWRIIQEKDPHRSYHQDFVLQPINATTTVSAKLGAQGGLIAGPMIQTPAGPRPAFLLELYPNPNIPSDFQISWSPGGYHSVGVETEVRKKIRVKESGQEIELDAYRPWEALGSVYVTPHIPAPPGGGPVGELRLLYVEPLEGSEAGDYTLVEGLDDNGEMEFVNGEEAFPDGVLINHQGVLYASSLIPHFSSVTKWREVRMKSGKTIWVRLHKDVTADQDGDGEVNWFDSAPFCFGGLCPNNEQRHTMEWTATVTTTESKGKTSGKTNSFEGETGEFISMFAKGMVGTASSTNWSTSKATGNSVSVSWREEVQFKYDLQVPLLPDPPDCLEKCAHILWQLIDLKFAMCTYPYPSDIHICGDQKHSKEPDTTIALPSGVVQTRRITGHCPFCQ